MNPRRRHQRGTSLIEVIFAMAIVGGAVSASAYQLSSSTRFRKTTFERATVVSLADSASVQASYYLRRTILASIKAKAPSIHDAVLLAIATGILKAPPGPPGITILTKNTAALLPPASLKGAASYRRTVDRCRGKTVGRSASPSLSASTAYLCFVVAKNSALPEGIWAGVDSKYPVISEMAVQPFDVSTDANLRFDDLKPGMTPTALRLLYTVVWVTEKSGDMPAAVRWFAKEHYAPLR